LGIDATLFLLEIIVGWLAQSTALIADSLDMLADAVVYGIGLYAVGRAAADKVRAARWSGYFQGLLALLILADIVRRMIFGSEPVSMLMIGMGIIALIGNLICLRLIYAHRHGDVHMRASWIFSANDVIANIGVIIAGLLVMWLDTRWPDLIIGLIIAAMVLRGAWRILDDTRREEAMLSGGCNDSCSSSHNSQKGEA
jgi:cation diffusion facilitator family transporter